MAGRFVTLAGRQAICDVGLAVALLAVVLLLGPPNPPSELLWWGAALVGVVAVALRNRWPLATMVVGTTCAAVHVAYGSLVDVTNGAVLIFVYTVAARRSRRASLTALACVLLVMFGWCGWFARQGHLVPGMPVLAFQVKHAKSDTGPTLARTELITGDHASVPARWGGPAVLGGVLVASWAIGNGARNRRSYLDQVTARAHDLERAQDQRAALAVAAERGRISRELHDVVAHGMSLIVIQAQGGAAALDHQPAETRAALAAIVATGRGSLADMRRVLDAMDEVDDAWHPQPGLAQLSTLVEQVHLAGAQVRFRVGGSTVPLPVPVDLSAYRIVQEALTNVMKHAGAGATADIVLTYRETALDLCVSDDGRSSEKPATGNGINGMRERVRLLGGTFNAGVRAGGGFEVRATLPIGQDRT